MVRPYPGAFLTSWRNIQKSKSTSGVSDQHIDLIGSNVDCVIRGGPLSDLFDGCTQIGDDIVGDLRHACLSCTAWNAQASERLGGRSCHGQLSLAEDSSRKYL